MLNIKKITLGEEIDNSELTNIDDKKKDDIEDDMGYPVFGSEPDNFAYYKSFYDIELTISNDKESIDLTRRIDLCSFHKKDIIEDSIMSKKGVFSKFDKDLITEYYGEHSLGTKSFASGIVPFPIANWYNENLKMRWNIIPFLDIKNGGIEYEDVYRPKSFLSGLKKNKNKHGIHIENTLNNIICTGFRIYFETKSEWTKYKLIST